jgi:hypothetical protein
MFEDFAAIRTDHILLEHTDQTLEEVRSALVTSNFFRLLGGKITLGRDFVEMDAQSQIPVSETVEPVGATQNSSSAAILSDDYWKRSYGGCPAVLGERLSSGTDSGPKLSGFLRADSNYFFLRKPKLSVYPTHGLQHV